MNKLKYIYRGLRYRFLIDPAEIAYLLKSLKPGSTAVDVGCHKGGYLYWMRKKVGKTGKVYGFEPQPKLYDYLREVKEAFNYENVIIENMGLSDQAGTFELHVPAPGGSTSPGATLSPVNAEDHLQTIAIPTSTLDDYFYHRGILPDFLKIDVEGHEKQVLLGGTKLLMEHGPAILMECERRHLKEGTVFDVFNVLDQFGYTGYFIQERKVLPLESFDVELHQKVGPGRFWAAPDYANNFIFEKKS